ncbi:MAG: histidine kinase dimerization/phosphoacceptor domain -containing protein [Halobacteriota archaeon]
MKIKKSELISTYAQSIGIEAAKNLIARKINAAALATKADYTAEEVARICGELAKESGLIRIVAQNFLVQLERKKVEEQTLLLDNIETQIWYLTDTETYGVVNKARADFLGYEQEIFEGKKLYDMVSKEEAGVCIASNREVFDNKRQIQTEQWVKNGKGETRLLAITKTPKLDAKGNVEYVICAAEDITERKRAEERIWHLNNVLKAIRTVNQLIVKEKDRDSLLQKACDALVETSDYDVVWLGFLGEGKTFDTVKGSGLQEHVSRFCEHLVSGDCPPCILSALAQKNPFVVIDKSRECRDCLFKNSYPSKTTAIIRVVHAGKLFGLLGVSFATAVVEAEIDLLKEVASDIAFALHDMAREEERKRAEDEIKKSLKEKEALLCEIHHRVKNNLQVVSSLLSMEARVAKGRNTFEVLSESRNRINAMALIHTQLYESGNLSEINMKGFVDRLLRQLFQSYPVRDTKITPVVQVAGYPLPVAIAVPVGLIINELLSNVFKHAFDRRREGRIEVSLRASRAGKINLSVSDDGVGLPEGYDINKNETLGLHLVKILVEDQLHGNLEVISKDGTTFKIEFDIESPGGI